MIPFLSTFLIRRRFKKLIADFDRQIEEARKKHAPVRDIVRAKRAFVHECLAASTASQQSSLRPGSAWRGAR